MSYESGLRRARRNVLAALDELAAIQGAMPSNDPNSGGE